MPVGLVVVSHSARIAARRSRARPARWRRPGAPRVAAGGTTTARSAPSHGGRGRHPGGRRRRRRPDPRGPRHRGPLGGDGARPARRAARRRVRLLDAPLVEGAVAAAVAAESGADLDAVAAAATGGPADPGPASGAEGGAAAPGDDSAGDDADSTVVLTDPDGLHARPAAALVAGGQGPPRPRSRCATRRPGPTG